MLSRVTGVPKEPFIGPVAVGVSDDGSGQETDPEGLDAAEGEAES